MYLLVAATELEIKLARSLLVERPEIECVVSGIGPVEMTLALSGKLAVTPRRYAGVINIGVAGAFVGTEPKLLDICLAGKEIFGDLGICSGDRIDSFAAGLPVLREFELAGELLSLAEKRLLAAGYPVHRGNFVTVNCASGTRARGEWLRDQHHALCENMEGAAAARVCQHFDVPLLELRCISNLVEDRDTSRWRLAEASERACRAAVQVLESLASNNPEG